MRATFCSTFFIIVVILSNSAFLDYADETETYNYYLAYQKAESEAQNSINQKDSNKAIEIWLDFTSRNKNNPYWEEATKKQNALINAYLPTIDLNKARLEETLQFLIRIKDNNAIDQENIGVIKSLTDKINNLLNPPRPVKPITEAPFPGYEKMGENSIKSQKDGSEMMLIPALNLYMDKNEITVSQYKKFCDATNRRMPQGEWNNTDNQPIASVSYEDAEAYCQWAGRLLPTREQWEYVYQARNAEANANPFGLYDTFGGVWEWCSDPINKNGNRLVMGSLLDPKNPDSANRREVIAGWNAYNTGFRTVISFRR